MTEFILLMHNDVPMADPLKVEEAWGRYLATLQASGRYDGGSAIGGGIGVKKDGTAGAISNEIGGYLRVRAESLDEAKQFLVGNPVFEAGGTVEIRELLET